jgi:HAMP domain-containing protein
MQKPQKSEEILSISEQISNFSTGDNLNLESTTESGSGRFNFFETFSLRTQQIITSLATGLISSLIVVTIIQLFANRISQSNSTALPQLTEIGMAAFLTAVAVGVITFALQSAVINQINRDIDHLQEQCKKVASGDLSTQLTIASQTEIGQLAVSFNQMSQAINTRIQEAQEKADEQEKVKADLQQQLLQLLQGVEEEFYSNSALYPEEEAIIENEQAFAQPEGTLLEFLDRLLNVDITKEVANPQVFFGSSKIQEIQRHQDELQYREIWLQALLNETQKQLKFVTFMTQRAELKKDQVVSELQK